MSTNPLPKKILIVCPSFNLGGIERSLSNLANHFVTQNIEVVFVSLLAGEIFFELDDRIKVVSPSFERQGNVLKHVLYRIRLVFFVREQIKENKPDIILSLSDTFNVVALLANLGLGVKIFIGDVTKPDRKFNFSTRMAKKYIYPLSTGFIAQTKHAAKFYQEKFGNKLNIRVINGAVKAVTLYPEIKREQIILVVGRLSFEKGQDRMVEIFDGIKNKQGWKLLFTAEGPFRSQLEKLIITKKLSNQISLLGQVENIDKLYATAGILAMPSRMEGFPNALCEAMAAGLPCVAFDSFPADEIITDSVDGYIIKDGDIVGFTNRLEQLMNSREKREEIGQNAIHVAERLNIEKIGKQFLEFFRKR